MNIPFSFLFLALATMLGASPSFAADEDGRCLRAAERHCAAILETFGEARYRECVSRRIQACLGGARGQVHSMSFAAPEASLELGEDSQQEL